MHGQVRRRVYLAICVLGLVGCAWQIAGAEGHPLERTVSFPLLAAFLLGAGVVLVWFPSRIRWVEVGGFVVLAAVWLTTMALQLATAPTRRRGVGVAVPRGVRQPVPARGAGPPVVRHEVGADRLARRAGGGAGGGAAALRPRGAGERRYAPDLVGALGYVAVLAMLAFLMARSKEALAVSRAEAARLRELAHTDVLTGLPNRRSLIDALHTAVQDRRAGGSTAVVLFDLDHFKAVNDRYGHDVGDLVLQEVAEVVRASLRPDAVFGRWGGEEFLVVVPRADLDDGAAVAERLRGDISAHGFPADWS